MAGAIRSDLFEQGFHTGLNRGQLLKVGVVLKRRQRGANLLNCFIELIQHLWRDQRGIGAGQQSANKFKGGFKPWKRCLWVFLSRFLQQFVGKIRDLLLQLLQVPLNRMLAESDAILGFGHGHRT